MNRFLAFLKKEFLHIFRDVRTLIIIFGLPIVQILIFGFVVSTDVNNAKIAIVDYSKDELSEDLISKISNNDFFVLAKYLENENDIEREFKKGTINAALIIPNNFEKDFKRDNKSNMSLILDGTEPNTASLIGNAFISVMSKFLNEKNINSENMNMQITPDVKMFYNEELKSEYMFVPGVISLILMLISALMTSVSITREKEFGTMEILLVSPLKPIQIILGKVVPYLILSFLNVIFILMISYFVFGLAVKGSVILLLAESVLYILLSLSIGIFISTSAKTMQQAMFISLVGLLLPSVLLSGFIFPIDNMPIFYNYLCKILPPTWYIVIIKNIMIKGLSFNSVYIETLILLAMTIFFILISAKKFKIRLG